MLAMLSQQSGSQIKIRLEDINARYLEMRSTIRCGVCSTCLTILVSPDSAGGDLDRTRVVSLRGSLFVFSSNFRTCVFVRIDGNKSEISYVRKLMVQK